MSSSPTGRCTPSIRAMFPASLRASGTPRVWMPIRHRSSVPSFFSRISCAMRTSVRSMAAASMTFALHLSSTAMPPCIEKRPVRVQTRRQRAGRPHSSSHRDSIGRDTLPVSRTDLKISSCVKYHHRRQLSIRNSQFRRKKCPSRDKREGQIINIYIQPFLKLSLSATARLKTGCPGAESLLSTAK